MPYDPDELADLIAEVSAKLDAWAAGSGGSGGGGSLLAYAFNASSTGGSLAHMTGAEIGRSYQVAAFGNNGRGAGLWTCFAAPLSSPTIGARSYVDGVGIVMEGVGGRFVLVAPDTIDPAQVGGTLDSRAAGQQAVWTLAIDHTAATRAVLRPTGDLIAATGLDLSGVRMIDGRSVEFFEAVTGHNGVLVTLDMSAFKNSDPRDSWLAAKGINVGPDSADGEYDFQGVKSQATGFILQDDNGGMSARRFMVERLATGLVVKGNTEKNVYHIHAVYCGVAVRGDTSDGSPDTLRLHIAGTNNKQAFIPDDGDTSYIIDLNTEGRIDDGTEVACYWNPAINRPVAYIEAKNGKHFKIGGRHRAHNGRLFLTDDREYEAGADTLEFDRLGVVHCYGTIYSNYRVQHLKGELLPHDCLNGRPNFAATDDTGGSIPCPTVHLRQVWDASGFAIKAESISARECVRWGDTELDLYSIGAHLGHYQGNMGRLAEEDGTELNFNPRAGIYPTDQTYLHIEKGVRNFAIFEAWGNIVAEVGSIDNRLRLPHGANWVMAGQRATDEAGDVLPAGRLSIDLEGDLPLDELLWRPWAFDGMSAVVPALGGRISRTGGKWSMATPPAVSIDALESSSHWLNSKVKREGAQVFANGAPLFASGPAATDAWVDAAGADVVASASIGEQAATTAFLSRVSSAGGGTMPAALREAYDALFFDLSDSGVMAKLILLYVFWTQDAATAKLNLVSGLIAGPYDLTAVNSPTFTAMEGYRGNGTSSYLASGFNSQTEDEGMGLADMHIGLFSLASGGGNVFDAGSRDNNRLRIGSQDSGLIYSTSASNDVSTFQSGIGAAPHHVMASRGASPTGGRAYRNGELLGVDGIAPSGSFLPTTVDILRQGTDYSEELVGAFHVGLDLSDTQAAAMSRALRKMAIRLGVIR